MTIKPSNYNLTLEPDLQNFTFKGIEVITFQIEKPLKEIILDAADLNIHSVILGSESDSRIKQRFWTSQNDKEISFRLEPKNEKLIILLKEELKSGAYKLQIEYEGTLNNKLTGFYRSRYMVEGKEKIMATSQFEAADARRAFPCIDNPSFKATFDVSLVIDKKLTAISNTLPNNMGHSGERSDSRIDSGQARMTDKKNKKTVNFETTPLMSTYLLYLGVGEFEFLEDVYTSEVNRGPKNTSEVRLRIVTTPGKKQFGKFALEAAKKSLAYFEEYFDYPYPLNKLDLIAVPEFASGAMENWGAITFRENALLFYPDKSSKATQQRIAEVVAHELAHQWFGNLVTMKWWDDLWLNESFATYMAHKALDKYWPEWNIWSQYVTDTVFEGMALDSLKTSHPIKVEVKNVSELEELFDEIAYSKGGSILRMLDIYLGENNFRDGLRKYVKKFLYKNAQAQDLWSSLEEVSGKKVMEIMQSFILQTGFPNVSVKEKNNVLTFNQQRFLYEGEDTKTKWKTPMVLKNGTDTLSDIYLPERMLTIKFNPEDKLATINHKYSGFFISDYSEELLEVIGKNLNHLTDIDKVGLIHDLFALVLTGKKELISLYRYIEMYFFKVSSSLVLHYLVAKLSGIQTLIGDKESKRLLIKLAKCSLVDLIGYEPKEDESIFDSYLRNTSISALTLLEDVDVSKFVANKFADYLKNESSLHSDLRAVIFSSAVRINDNNYEIVKNLYRASKIQEEKAKFLIALGNSKNKKLISDALAYTLNPEVPLAFLPYAISPIGRNKDAKELAYQWLLKDWEKMLKLSGGLANMLLRRVLQTIVPTCAIGKEKEIEEFLRKNKEKGLERSVEQVLEMLRVNSRFVKNNSDANLRI